MKRIDFSQLERVVGGLCDLSGESANLRALARVESFGGDPYAANPTSSARGGGQLTSINRLSILGDDYDTVDCGQQVAAMKQYIGKRYRNDGRALAFRRRKGWY